MNGYGDDVSYTSIVSRPLDLIACPVCHARLEPAGADLACSVCERTYLAEHGLTPVPPPDAELQARWPLWEKLQENFAAAANAVPEDSLSVTERPDAEAFARFCDLSGVVLDVGCGPQRLPTYALVDKCRFIGVDPLAGEPERAFEFVQGLGEYLPFRDECFDQVLFATSLDHMLVPRRALAEALRVLAPGGAINVWFGELDRPPQGGAVRRARHRVGAVIDRIRTEQPQEPEYLAALERPQGAIDKFHVAQPGEREIAGWFADLGLELSAAERIDYCSGCFMRGSKPRSE